MILRVGIEHSILCTIYVNWVTVSRQEWTIVIFDICLGRVSQKYHKGNLLFKNTIIKVKAASTYLYAVWKIWQHGAYLKINVALSFTLCCICHSTHLLVLYFHYFIYSTQDSALNNTYYMKLSKFQETSFVKNIDRNNLSLCVCWNQREKQGYKPELYPEKIYVWYKHKHSSELY